MNFEQVLSRITEFPLHQEITKKAQQEVAPLRNNSFSETTIQQAKKAAVLLLIHQKNEKACFTLIERAEYDGTHSKQFALPGGKAELTDSNIIETAIREAEEEVNINAKEIKIIGELTSIYIPPSNFYVTPILAISEIRPNYIKQESEVKSIFEIPLTELFKNDVVQKTQLSLKKGIKINTPYLNLEEKIIWGATAMILNEFRWGLMNK